MAGVTWDSIFPGNSSLVRKVLYGSVLVRDYDPTNDFASWSPFDSTSGLLSSTLLTDDGFQDVGFLDENGVSFDPTYSTADTTAWQTRQPLRTDVTADTEQAAIVALQSTPLTDALYNNVPLSTVSPLGTPGYSMIKPKTPGIVYRSVLFLGVDGSAGDYIFLAVLYPKALMVKPDKQDWVAKTELQVPITFQAYPDSASGFTIKRWRDGPGWRALALPNAPDALTVGSVTATTIPVTWSAPATGPAPTSYTVSVTAGGSTVPDATFTPSNPNTTTAATVGGLVTATHYTVAVVSNSANGSSPAATVEGTTS
ncbi:MAG TPA: fibronectin type III domain-containing protein [Pseudonocardiaceae bacterium]|nr:fibronectin type III domain-containing protein [Pseudonocardiaceae bacterium]